MSSGPDTGERGALPFTAWLTNDDLQAKEREILELLTGLCAAPERDELRIAALRALLADVRAHQAQERDEGEG